MALWICDFDRISCQDGFRDARSFVCPTNLLEVGFNLSIDISVNGAQGDDSTTAFV